MNSAERVMIRRLKRTNYCDVEDGRCAAVGVEKQNFVVARWEDAYHVIGFKCEVSDDQVLQTKLSDFKNSEMFGKTRTLYGQLWMASGAPALAIVSICLIIGLEPDALFMWMQ